MTVQHFIIKFLESFLCLRSSVSLLNWGGEVGVLVLVDGAHILIALRGLGVCRLGRDGGNEGTGGSLGF